MRTVHGGPECRGRPPSSKQKNKTIFPLQRKLGHLNIKHKNVLLQHSYLRECLGVLCTWVKLLTHLQVLGCELRMNAFGGGLRADPLWEI